MLSFRRDERGAVALLFAFALIPMVLAVGAGIDISRATVMRQKLQAAADSAAVSALANATTKTPKATMIAKASAAFEANIRGSLSEEQLKAEIVHTVGVTVDTATGNLASTISFEARMPTTFMNIAGFSDLTVVGNASAETGTRKYVDFHFLVDLSDSMGLAATDKAREILKTASTTTLNSGETCEFACHIKVNAHDKDTLLNVARAKGVKLRVDVAKDGMRSLISQAEKAKEHETVSRFSITAFNGRMWPISGLSQDYASLRTAVGKLELGYGYPKDDANTWFDVAAPAFIEELQRINLGGGSGGAEKVVVLVSDGLQSQDGGSGYTNGKKQIRVFDKPLCEAIKTAGYRLAVVYTKYYPIPYNGWYNTHVKPIYNDIETNMRNCATPGLFAVGDTPEEIDAAFSTVFQNALRATHLTH